MTDVVSFIERVELRGDSRAVTRALERWKTLEREGWNVTALVDEPAPGTHMIGLGCLEADQLALRTATR